ncbi:hypothetical protein P376_0714 [Streptomyces sp. HCCB10043]|nr:hypothetical protein P376_0714 [Streptomyces sp. HCCB10043]
MMTSSWLRWILKDGKGGAKQPGREGFLAGVRRTIVSSHGP